MSGAAFTGVALFVWSRHRFLIVGAVLLHLAAFSAFDPSSAHAPGGLGQAVITYLRAATFFLPLLLFTTAVNVATADLAAGDSWFPRNFFTLPLDSRRLALPFMTFTLVSYGLLWAAALAITDGAAIGAGPRPMPGDRGPQIWEPFLHLALLTWLQAVIWRPFTLRWSRIVLLFAMVFAWFVGLVLSIEGGFPDRAVALFWIAQVPLAYYVGMRGIARARYTGESARPRRRGPVQRRPRAMRPFRSPIWAQRWYERRVQRGRATVVVVFVISLLVLTGVLATAFGAFAGDPRPFARQAIALLVWTLLMGGSAAGPAFAAFDVRAHIGDTNAFRMPSFFAALPLSTGDFAWAKLATAARRIALMAAIVFATAAALLLWAFPGEAWTRLLSELVTRYGAVDAVLLPLGLFVAFVGISATATANLVWIGLFGRGWKIASGLFAAIVVAIVVQMSWLGAEPARFARFLDTLPGVLPWIALVKVALLAALAYAVGTRRLYSWARLGAIGSGWAVAAGLPAIAVLRYVPGDSAGVTTLLAASVALTPVLGIVAAPLALQLNRCR